MMMTSGLATRLRDVPPHASPPEQEPPPPTPARSLESRRRSTDRVTYWAILCSIALHLLILILSPLFIQTVFPPGGSAGAPRAVGGGPFGMQAIDVIPSATAPDEPFVPPVERVTAPARNPTVPVSVAPTQASAGGGDAADPDTGQTGGDATTGGEVGDALRPGYRDPRLYVMPSPYEMETTTDHEEYLERFQARIDAVNDSLGLAAARNRTTSDWTVTDEEGRKWGLSPDGLHLGDVTIPRALLPLPGATGDNASREAAREEERQRQEIIRQEAERQRRETQNERIREMGNARGGGAGPGGSGGSGEAGEP